MPRVGLWTRKPDRGRSRRPPRPAPAARRNCSGRATAVTDPNVWPPRHNLTQHGGMGVRYAAVTLTHAQRSQIARLGGLTLHATRDSDATR